MSRRSATNSFDSKRIGPLRLTDAELAVAQPLYVVPMSLSDAGASVALGIDLERMAVMVLESRLAGAANDGISLSFVLDHAGQIDVVIVIERQGHEAVADR